MNKVITIVFAYVLSSLLLQAGDAFGQAVLETVPRFSPGQWSVGGRFSETVQEVFVDALVPVWKPGDSMLHVNVRGSFLEDKEQQISAGLVARHLWTGPRLILGLNAYADQRWTELDNRFEQVGAGIEVLSPWVDLRANYYYPLSDGKTACQSPLVSVSEGDGQHQTTTTLMKRYEAALEGYDVEIGVWLPYLATRMPTALFVGYEDFSSDYGHGLSGAKLRMESRVHPYVTLDAEWFEDHGLNRSDYYVGVRLHIPLHFSSRAGHKRRGWRDEAFAARMGERVIRRQLSTIKTGPVIAGQVVETEASVSPVGPPAPVPPPNCYLDAEGEVVCD